MLPRSPRGFAVSKPQGVPEGPWPPVRDDLAGEVAYGAPQIDVPVRLNTNENPFGPSPAMVADVAAAVSSAAMHLNRYPDRDALALREDLARYVSAESNVDCSATGVWVANGSNEVMEHLLAAFGGPGRSALSFAPTYSMYSQYARDSHTAYLTIDRAPDFSLPVATAVQAIEAHEPHVVFLTSPNNPTGTALPLDVIDAACAVAPGIVVVDEAYAEFRRPGTPSALSLLTKHRNLVVTRTMSKAFALAGGRLGYAIAAPSIIAALQLVRLPYHLSTVSQVVARVALAHSDDLLSQVGILRQERDAMVEWLRGSGFTAVDSDANFILFGLFMDAHAVWQGLLDQGVLIRESGPEGWLRVSIGTPRENAAFRDALVAMRDASGMIVTDESIAEVN